MSSPRSNGSLTEEEINRALYDEFQQNIDRDGDDDSESASSDGDRTVRGQVVLSPSYKGPHSPSSRSNSEFGSEGRPPRYATSRYGSSPGSRSLLQLVSQQQQSPASRSSPDTWRIHFKKPPGSSVVLEGPITWIRLESLLKLDDEKVGVDVSEFPETRRFTIVLKFEDEFPSYVCHTIYFSNIFVARLTWMWILVLQHLQTRVWDFKSCRFQWVQP